MAYGADIIDDYKWRHPKWEDAIKREDAQMWLEANKREGKNCMLIIVYHTWMNTRKMEDAA